MEDVSFGVTPAILKDLQHKYGVKASKALGQNFLVDSNICQKISSSLQDGENVIEIGPGIGSLTLHLAKRANTVTAIELDTHMLKPLNDILSRSNSLDQVDVLNEDVMKVDLQSLSIETNSKKIFGNLPYNISAPLIANIVRGVDNIETLIVMVQKEVGERLLAKQGTRDVGAITYKCQYFMEIEKLFQVPKMSFIPRPHVDSIVIKLTRKPVLELPLESSQVNELFSIIDVAFAKRRKMLRQSLKDIFGENLAAIFETANVDPEKRPEQLTNENFLNLYNAKRLIA